MAQRTRTEWRHLRRKALLTQKRLAQVLGISYSYVRQIESGAKRPGINTLSKFRTLKAKYAKPSSIFS